MMKLLRANRTLAALSGAALGLALAGCPAPAEPPENQEAPPPDVVDIDPEEVEPIQQPQPQPQPQDCNALPTPQGGTLNCSATFGSAAAYCENVSDNASLTACINCDGTYAFAPEGTDAIEGCDVGGVPPPVDVLEETTCKGCHAPSGYGGPSSIEEPHPWVSQQCTTCHGGDGTATNKTFAHVCAPPEIGNRQLQALDPRAFFLSFTHAGVEFLPDYECAKQDGTVETVTAVQWLAFQNPGDLRVGRAGLGCGTCHTEYVDALSRSVMGNATGLNSGTRHGIGAPNVYPDRNEQVPTFATDFNTLGDYAAKDVTDPDYGGVNDPDRVVGQVGSLKRAEVFTGETFKLNPTYDANQVNNSYNVNDLTASNYPNGIVGQVSEQLFQEVLNQACTGCHLQNKYNNNRAGDYRSAGCTACHFETNVFGRSASSDPNVRKDEPYNVDALLPGEQTHIANHRVRNVRRLPGEQGVNQVVLGIANQSCIVCHEGSNRTVAQYEGYRLDQNQDLTNANFYPSNNTVVFTLKTELFNENQTFNNRNVNQWIKDEIWQNDVANLVGAAGQDETPEDIHHEAGMGCIDCHGTGATHGRGKIYSRMKVATHENDVMCETCHGTADAYAITDGANLVDRGGQPLTNTYATEVGDFWLVSKVTGSTHYIPQTKDVVDASNLTFDPITGIVSGGKQYPPGAQKNGAVFSLVGSYAMGTYNSAGGLQDGFGPLQPNNANLQMREGFNHSTGTAVGQANQNLSSGMECYTCHAAWQNNCIGCHLDAAYDDNPANFFYSQVTGERIYFNFNANFVYQNPINFMLGLNDRGRISPYQGLHRFFSYTDLNGNTSNRMAYGDRNGLGNDPALRLATRNNLPALQNQPFTPHSIRGRLTTDKIGGRACVDCHLTNANNVVFTDQQNQTWDLTNYIANQEDYANAIALNVQMAYGLGSALWEFDANGDPVVDTNNAPAYDLDRLVEAQTGVTNSSSNHPLLQEARQYSPYNEFVSTNLAQVARPLTAVVLNRMDYINNIAGGLGNVYGYNATPGEDPNATHSYTYYLRDYAYATQ